MKLDQKITIKLSRKQRSADVFYTLRSMKLQNRMTIIRQNNPMNIKNRNCAMNFDFQTNGNCKTFCLINWLNIVFSSTVIQENLVHLHEPLVLVLELVFERVKLGHLGIPASSHSVNKGLNIGNSGSSFSYIGRQFRHLCLLQGSTIIN